MTDRGVAAELERLAGLYETGLLTSEQYEAAKDQMLGIEPTSADRVKPEREGICESDSAPATNTPESERGGGSDFPSEIVYQLDGIDSTRYAELTEQLEAEGVNFVAQDDGLIFVDARSEIAADDIVCRFTGVEPRMDSQDCDAQRSTTPDNAEPNETRHRSATPPSHRAEEQQDASGSAEIPPPPLEARSKHRWPLWAALGLAGFTEAVRPHFTDNSGTYNLIEVVVSGGINFAIYSAIFSGIQYLVERNRQR